MDIVTFINIYIICQVFVIVVHGRNYLSQERWQNHVLKIRQEFSVSGELTELSTGKPESSTFCQLP